LHCNKSHQTYNFGKLTNLTELSLDVLEIWHKTEEGMVKNTLVPIEICNLNNLLVLKLRVLSGYISFPPEIRSLNHLEELDLADNNLSKLPF
jgi:hypothetical protein